MSVERFGSVLPNFVFPSIPRLCSGPAFSEISFWSLFWASVIEHPY